MRFHDCYLEVERCPDCTAFYGMTVASDRLEEGPVGGRGALEHELVVSQPSADGYQLAQRKTAVTIEFEDFFRLGDFKRQAANPIDDVSPGRHSAVSRVVAPGSHWLQFQSIE